MKLSKRIALAWRILRAKPGNLLAHAERELGSPTDPYAVMAADAVKELVFVFGTQGHSGFSASWMRGALSKLLAYEPLGPLTGEDSEWELVGDEPNGVKTWQNKRCSRVFRQTDRFDGQAYDLNGKIFREPDGVTFTSSESFTPITFPYTPTSVYVDVPSLDPDDALPVEHHPV